MNWEREHSNWSLPHLSRRICLRSHRWHVQEVGDGDTLLLLHGAGASTHSWRDIIPILADRYHVIALDLPGHGFTQITGNRRRSLTAMTQDITTLCARQNWSPRAIIGHSAGAAIALNLSLCLPTFNNSPPVVVGINPALGRFEGVAGWLFPLLAKLLALNPLTSHLFAAGRNSTARARRLISGTGSSLAEEGIGYYARLISDRDHVEGALQMMAQWDIDNLLDHLGDIHSRCLFVVGENDRAVKPAIAERTITTIRNAEILRMKSLGHLAHEEAPEKIAETLLVWISAAYTNPGADIES
ncbi:alpha/beta fold hydrolase BchO [uncultured Roseovarius sp.]|uniref:alpha/beta fold hydrolase BchO n=1 Tax=uncultured Roseovarius sp. TaxID=293344 RepID=UPI002631DEA4|nr:alpha/beta fold hydrolase BchO [uncultured Roseovarius sp.]